MIILVSVLHSGRRSRIQTLEVLCHIARATPNKPRAAQIRTRQERAYKHQNATLSERHPLLHGPLDHTHISHPKCSRPYRSHYTASLASVFDSHTCTALRARLLFNPNPLLLASRAQVLICSSDAKLLVSSLPASLPRLYPALKLNALRKTTTPADTTHVISVGVMYKSSLELDRRAFFNARRSRLELRPPAGTTAFRLFSLSGLEEAEVEVDVRRMVGWKDGSWN